MGRQVVRFVDSQLKFDSRLVSMIKQHKHLFDRTHKLFEDETTRIETWECIAKELGTTESYCEKRWIYIINRFYDEFLWMLKYSTNSLWLLYTQLEFLEELIDWDDLICDDLMEYETEMALDGV